MKSERSGFGFTRFSKWIACKTGNPGMFICAVAVVFLWAVTGPIFRYSDTWQLIINTGTTIVTFLMVFLIQHTQNRDTAALQLKLDELIRAVNGARNEFLSAEEMEDNDLETLKNEFANLAEIARQKEPAVKSGRGNSSEQASVTV
ncbi:MAG: low affinity iron permease family protein [Acidobacteriota bacterium]